MASPAAACPATAAVPGTAPQVWIVFCDCVELAWLRTLRRGFRHCFAVLQDDLHWITIDPLSPCLEVKVAPVPPNFDLPGWLARQGHTVVAARPRRGLTRPAPWAPFTCVETCKRLLGLHDPLVLTPWQLYRRLTASAAASPQP